MVAVLAFLILIPGGLLYSDHIDRKIDACWKRGESFCTYRMKPLNSPKRKRYLESLEGGIDKKLECEVWLKADEEFAISVLGCDPLAVVDFDKSCPFDAPSMRGIQGCRPRWA